MDLLNRARPILIAVLFAALGGVGVSGYEGNTKAMAWFGSTAHLCLFLFVTTEAFGRVSYSRSFFARSLARVVFGMYVLFWGGLLAMWLRVVS